jgi:hypothetical protein
MRFVSALRLEVRPRTTPEASLTVMRVKTGPWWPCLPATYATIVFDATHRASFFGGVGTRIGFSTMRSTGRSTNTICGLGVPQSTTCEWRNEPPPSTPHPDQPSTVCLPVSGPSSTS